MNRVLTILRARPMRIALTITITALLIVLLVATIFWSLFDAQWLAFLGGVLFAAVLAIATQASKAEWLAMRRAKQLERCKELLARETARGQHATEAMRMIESRLQLIGNAVPSLIFFVDRDQRCRFHNSSVEKKTGLKGEKISGQLLRDVVGSAAYAGIEPHIADALAGRVNDYEMAWENAGAGALTYSVRHVPYPSDSAEPIGFYLLATAVMPAPATPAASTTVAATGGQTAGAAAGVLAGAGVEGNALYVKSISDELNGWDDPRTSLMRALEDDQFLLFAQKILPLEAGRPDPSCCEVLLRLREEEENLLPPGNFIPVAEQYGLMEQLDRWVVRSLIAWCGEKSRRDPIWRRPLYCLNLSESAVTSESFAAFVLGELQRSGFAARSLCFEIGEQDALSHKAEVRRLVSELKPAGCRFAVDSFGSVKVSFSCLEGLPFDFVKIDGFIVQNMLRDASGFAKVSAINRVCQKIGIRTIAKFVESEEALKKLREIGVDYAQGFSVAHPEPIDKVF